MVDIWLIYGWYMVNIWLIYGYVANTLGLTFIYITENHHFLFPLENSRHFDWAMFTSYSITRRDAMRYITVCLYIYIYMYIVCIRMQNMWRYPDDIRRTVELSQANTKDLDLFNLFNMVDLTNGSGGYTNKYRDLTT